MYTIQSILLRKNKEWSLINSGDNAYSLNYFLPNYTMDSFDELMVTDLLKGYDDAYVNISMEGDVHYTQYRLKTFSNINLVQDAVSIQQYFTYEVKDVDFPEPVEPALMTTGIKKVTYHDIWSFGLQADRGVYSNTVLVPSNSNLPDVKITKPSSFPTNLNTLRNKILYLVNGVVFFPTIASDNEVWLVGASKYLDVFTHASISIIDFSNLNGYVKKTPTIDTLSIFSFDVSGKNVYFHIEEDLNDYTPLLVLNGNLHILNSRYTIIDNHTICLHLKYKNMIKECVGFEVKEFDWVSPASYDGQGFNIRSIDVVKYLTLGNTSVLLLHTNKLSVKEEILITSGFADKYISMNDPDGIMFLTDGTVGDYNVTQKTNYGNEISTSSPKLLNALMDTIPDGANSLNTMSLGDYTKPTTAKILELYVL